MAVLRYEYRAIAVDLPLRCMLDAFDVFINSFLLIRQPGGVKRIEFYHYMLKAYYKAKENGWINSLIFTIQIENEHLVLVRTEVDAYLSIIYNYSVCIITLCLFLFISYSNHH